MPWLYSPVTGLVEHQNEAEFIADSAVNIAGFTKLTELPIPDGDTMAQAVAYVQAQQKAGKLQGKAPTTSTATANANANAFVASSVPGGAAVVDVAGFLSALTTKALWIRVAKIIIGGALVLIGVAHMTGATNAAAAAARRVPLPV